MGGKKKQTGIFLCEGSKRTVLKFRYALFIHHSQKQKIEHPTQQRFVWGIWMTQKNTVTLVRPLDVIAEDDLPNQTHIWHL